MGKINLKYSFNDPNSLEDTFEMLFKFFIEVNMSKVEELINTIVNRNENNDSHPE